MFLSRSPPLEATILPSRSATPPPLVPTTPTTISELLSPFLKRSTMANSADTTNPFKDNMPMADCLEAMMAIQQTTVLQLQATQAQGQADQEASAACIARLEEVALNPLNYRQKIRATVWTSGNFDSHTMW
ncbi:hypothetical protein Pst134EB_023924 [Puccinia striiformis f. sp. tritici]|nr:hypothetical protein Pst134EB_023924 [Puccinia striiformis f. sp. tritici]